MVSRCRPREALPRPAHTLDVLLDVHPPVTIIVTCETQHGDDEDDVPLEETVEVGGATTTLPLPPAVRSVEGSRGSAPSARRSDDNETRPVRHTWPDQTTLLPVETAGIVIMLAMARQKGWAV